MLTGLFQQEHTHHSRKRKRTLGGSVWMCNPIPPRLHRRADKCFRMYSQISIRDGAARSPRSIWLFAYMPRVLSMLSWAWRRWGAHQTEGAAAFPERRSRLKQAALIGRIARQRKKSGVNAGGIGSLHAYQLRCSQLNRVCDTVRACVRRRLNFFRLTAA